MFFYRAKTPNLRYDMHPMVAVTDVFEWGFRGINFHWNTYRNYTWNEIVEGGTPPYTAVLDTNINHPAPYAPGYYPLLIYYLS